MITYTQIYRLHGSIGWGANNIKSTHKREFFHWRSDLLMEDCHNGINIKLHRRGCKLRAITVASTWIIAIYSVIKCAPWSSPIITTDQVYIILLRSRYRQHGLIECRFIISRFPAGGWMGAFPIEIDLFVALNGTTSQAPSVSSPPCRLVWWWPTKLD